MKIGIELRVDIEKHSWAIRINGREWQTFYTNVWGPNDKCVYCGNDLNFPMPAGHVEGTEYICTDCAAKDLEALADGSDDSAYGLKG